MPDLYNIDPVNGFLPAQAPLELLPDEFEIWE